MELVVLTIAATAFITNSTLASHAQSLETQDQSVIFSYLRNNPNINTPLLAQEQTTTILARTDQWVSTALASSPFSGVAVTSAKKPDATADTTTIQENVVVKTNPADTNNFLRAGTEVYAVVPGDTLAGIASSFGISPQTIMLENHIDEGSTIKPGQKLTILPTTGISHKVTDGETVESIAQKFKVNEDDILDANDLELAVDVSAGDILVIPLEQVNMPAKPKPATPRFVKDESNKIALKLALAPADFLGNLTNFIWPTATRSITQGFSRKHTGIDISNSTKVAIYAAAAGFVEISGYQANGYGNTIVINHGNGVKTRYGHASELYVSAGDHVEQGQVIAKQGRTGRVRGATGIHLHFEVIKDGKRVNPLSYVRP